MGTGAKESNELAARLLGSDPDRSTFRFVKDDRGRAFERLGVRGFSRPTGGPSPRSTTAATTAILPCFTFSIRRRARKY
jgi:hypothetical protein